jgi:hypothetical protein
MTTGLLTSLAEAEKALVWRALVKALRAANMMMVDCV